MTLEQYYKNLPEPSYPKKEFIEELAKECNVSLGAARSWIYDGKKPSPEAAKIIEKLTNNKVIITNEPTI